MTFTGVVERSEVARYIGAFDIAAGFAEYFVFKALGVVGADFVEKGHKGPHRSDGLVGSVRSVGSV